MHLVEILLPLRDNQGSVLPEDMFKALRNILTDRFGGLTAFTRVPADGFWKEGDQGLRIDDIVVFEVMTEELDRSWWSDFRQNLEEHFRQKEIVIRAHAIERL